MFIKLQSLSAVWMHMRFRQFAAVQVLGNAKGVLAVGISILIFKNAFSPVAALGYAVTIAGKPAHTGCQSGHHLVAMLRGTRPGS